MQAWLAAPTNSFSYLPIFIDDDVNYRDKERGVTRISENIKNMSIVEKINMKYLGTLEHPLAKRLWNIPEVGLRF